MKQSYTPPEHILERYAELFVHFGIQRRDGKPPKKGSVVYFSVPEVAKPLYFHLQRAILKAGYHPLGKYVPNDEPDLNFSADFFAHASKAQRTFLPERYHKALNEQVDCTIAVIADTMPHALDAVPAKQVIERSEAMKQVKKWRFEKIDAGKLTWTLGLYGTDAMAKEAGMSTKQFWNQIIKACYLDHEDPVKEWRRINKTVQKTAEKLTKMQITEVHIEGEDMDLTLGIGEDRAWRAGGGNNIPSYEVFTSPDNRRAEGWARFNQPHYRYGKKIDGIELTFKNGRVVRSKATKNHDLLKSMLKAPGGDRLGEFSLTDGRLSRISTYMAQTLFDENMGGRYGNTHVALGSAYRDCFSGNMRTMTPKKWERRGYNDSSVHSDIISTTDRTVTATLKDGSRTVIYRDGKFQV